MGSVVAISNRNDQVTVLWEMSRLIDAACSEMMLSCIMAVSLS